MTVCFIGIGSNLDQPVEKAKQAIAALQSLPNSIFINCSSLYCSKPMGPSDQPDYINAVAQIETNLAPLELLDTLQQIELEKGRVRKDQRWGPRTLDLDILLYGNEEIVSERLTVPHYGMKLREFVLYPLAEISPKLRLPDGKTISDLLTACPLNGLQPYSETS